MRLKVWKIRYLRLNYLFIYQGLDFSPLFVLIKYGVGVAYFKIRNLNN